MKTHNLLLSSVAAFALMGSVAAAQTVETEEPELDADGQPIIVEGGTAATDALGGQIVAEQPDAEVEVTVDDPVVTVDQARPEVLVEQAEPQITVTVAEPTVTVEQQAPVITIEQAQPEVVVSIPEPVITVRMPEPDVNVATAEPEISVEQPEPIVRFVRPEPRITIEEAEPRVQVTSAEPEIRVNRADAAEVTVEKAEADVSIEEGGDANVEVTEAEPVINVEGSEEADVQVEQAEAEIVVEENAELAEVDTAALDVDGDVGDAGGLYATFAENRVSDLVGMNVLSASGNDVGEIDRLIRGAGGRLLAVVGVGGFLGLGEHDVAIPLDRFAMSEDDMVLEGLTEAQLEQMPEWDERGEEMPLGMTVGDAY